MGIYDASRGTEHTRKRDNVANRLLGKGAEEVRAV